jgi:hypothetical protein
LKLLLDGNDELYVMQSDGSVRASIARLSLATHVGDTEDTTVEGELIARRHLAPWVRERPSFSMRLRAVS